MTVEDLVKYYHTDNLAKLSRLVGFSRYTIYSWRRIGRIPYLSQLVIEKLTDGQLEAKR